LEPIASRFWADLNAAENATSSALKIAALLRFHALITAQTGRVFSRQQSATLLRRSKFLATQS
jgi:hypothetical protein